MLFNSVEFFIFFLTVLLLYYVLPHRWQNIMLLVASYFFYGWWDWRFLSLIFISTVVDYVCGIGIHNQANLHIKKRYLYFSVFVNLSLLGFFKYWNFFTDSLIGAMAPFGVQLDLPTLHLILPVGISFYTFQTMTYSVDIYRGKLKPTHDFLDFALFVSFFPQLVAGPIERAQKLLPQIQHKRSYNPVQFLEGLHLIFWGLFKKIFVADNLGMVVDRIYGAADATGFEYMLATFAFAFQIYGDFSGYTDVARGTAKCLGIQLMLNFKQPYLAINPSDFWRRWHISLSSWLRDYLYISLGGNRKGVWRTYRNLMLTMVFGGLWHGAAWNFVIWGAYHGLLLCLFRIFGQSRAPTLYPRAQFLAHTLKTIMMFLLTCGSWVLFRAQNIAQIGQIFERIFTGPWYFFESGDVVEQVIFFAAFPILVMMYTYLKDFEIIQPQSKIVLLCQQSLTLRSVTYGVLTYLLCFHAAKAQSFIYFQF